ncbi:MAG TPA: ABC transporter substrate-binding protein, partial [Deltaproteobacteria bacterium]|nr:ABC transporter substrate-binding protein [Deltaproteobacteria bacterium]
MKKVILACVLAAFVALFLAPAGVMAGSDEKINLKFSTW